VKTLGRRSGQATPSTHGNTALWDAIPNLDHGEFGDVRDFARELARQSGRIQSESGRTPEDSARVSDNVRYLGHWRNVRRI